jgi:hypothetical protein
MNAEAVCSEELGDLPFARGIGAGQSDDRRGTDSEADSQRSSADSLPSGSAGGSA